MHTKILSGSRIDNDPVVAMPITVVLPAYLAGYHLQDLLVRNGVPAEISIELPRGTRYCELQDLALQEGLTIEMRGSEIHLVRPKRKSLVSRLRHMIFAPQAI